MIIRALSGAGILLLGIIAPLIAEDSAPLRDEEIVRLFVSGISPAAIIDTIQSRQVDFDLSTEMQEELALAGLPAIVINAMIMASIRLSISTRWRSRVSVLFSAAACCAGFAIDLLR